MARAQGSQTSAKEDTVYLSLSSTPETDLSQYLTDLTASGSGAYESNSTRAQITTERTVSVRWTATAAEASVILMLHAPDAQNDYTWGIATTAGGNICLHQNLVALWTASATTAAKDYTVSWAMRDNPDTTGASDAKISEAIVYNHTDALVTEHEQFTHAAPTSSASWTLSVNGWWNGAALTNTPTNAVSKARVSSSYHPNVEVFEDWVSARTAYSGDADDGPVEPVGPVPVSSTLGDSAYFMGRANAGYVAEHALQVAKRSWSPLVNAVYSDAQEMTQAPAPAQWVKSAPGSAGYKMMLQYLTWEPVPTQATHAWIRVHLVSYVTSGAAVPVGVRVYLMNRIPGQPKIGAVTAPVLEHYHETAIVTQDHGVGTTGEWAELGYVKLPKFTALITGWTDTVHVAVAYDVDPANASSNDAAERLVIDALHVRPCVRLGVGVFDP